MSFYDTYLSLINEEIETDIVPELKESAFRIMILENKGKNIDIVKLFSTGVKHTLHKPQRVLYDDIDYYVGLDLYTNTYYICYKNLLMVDVDYYKDEVTETEIVQQFEDYCKEHPGYKFKLYRSRNGIHGFLISHGMDYRNDESIQLMLDLKSDFYYIVYAYLRGWSVRLNKKKTDTKDTLYEYICDIGEGKSDERLLKLVNLHIKLVEVFKNEAPNTMSGN